MNDPFAEGQEAYHRQEPLTANPYQPTRLRPEQAEYQQAWASGWQAASDCAHESGERTEDEE